MGQYSEEPQTIFFFMSHLVWGLKLGIWFLTFVFYSVCARVRSQSGSLQDKTNFLFLSVKLLFVQWHSSSPFSPHLSLSQLIKVTVGLNLTEIKRKEIVICLISQQCSLLDAYTLNNLNSWTVASDNLDPYRHKLIQSFPSPKEQICTTSNELKLQTRSLSMCSKSSGFDSPLKLLFSWSQEKELQGWGLLSLVSCMF